MGCVEVIMTNWQDVRYHACIPRGPNPVGEPLRINENGDPDEIVHSSDYRVQPPGERVIDGATAVFVLLCQHLLEARRRWAARLSQEAYSLDNDPTLGAIKAQGFTREIQKLIAMDTKARTSPDPNHVGNRFDINALVETIARLPNHVFSKWAGLFNLRELLEQG